MATLPLRTVTLALTVAALGTVMMVVGLLVVFDWPGKFPLSARNGVIIGVVLCCVAQFLYAVAADFLAPGADPRITGAFELAPWLVLAVSLIGGLIWTFA